MTQANVRDENEVRTTARDEEERQRRAVRDEISRARAARAEDRRLNPIDQMNPYAVAAAREEEESIRRAEDERIALADDMAAAPERLRQKTEALHGKPPTRPVEAFHGLDQVMGNPALQERIKSGDAKYDSRPAVRKDYDDSHVGTAGLHEVIRGNRR